MKPPRCEHLLCDALRGDRCALAPAGWSIDRRGTLRRLAPNGDLLVVWELPVRGWTFRRFRRGRLIASGGAVSARHAVRDAVRSRPRWQ